MTPERRQALQDELQATIFSDVKVRLAGRKVSSEVLEQMVHESAKSLLPHTNVKVEQTGEPGQLNVIFWGELL